MGDDVAFHNGEGLPQKRGQQPAPRQLRLRQGLVEPIGRGAETAPRLEGHAEKAVVQIHIQLAALGPNRMTRVMGVFLLGNDTIDFAETIDCEVVEPFPLQVKQ